jgi:ribokinase
MLLDQGWTGAARVIDEDRVRSASERAAAAAALVLDRLDFGFPTRDQIDVALQTRRVD